MKYKAIHIWIFVLISIFGCRIERTEVARPFHGKLPDIPPIEIKTSRAPLDQDILKWSPPQVSDFIYADYENTSVTHIPLIESAQIRASEDLIQVPPIHVESIGIKIDRESLRLYEVHQRNEPYIVSFDIVKTSQDKLFTVHFANDALLSMDYYFTSGIKFDYIDPALANSPFALAMLPYRQNSVNYHGITISQDFFTPTVLDTTAIQYGDRPFAGVLYAGQFKIALNPKKHYKQVSELDIGIMGPESLGGFVQTNIHETKPTGWVNQVKNDVVINYNVRIEKGLVNTGHFDFNGVVQGKAGTLYTNAGLGFFSRIGSFMPYFENIGLTGPSQNGNYSAKSKLQYAFTFSSLLNVVAYDATLQGGMFSENNIYTLHASEINRLVFNGSLGIEFTYKFFGFRTELHYITPEFAGGKEHRWVHMAATFCF